MCKLYTYRNAAMSGSDPNVWGLFLSQTPTALRWVVGGMAAALGAMCGFVLRSHTKHVDTVEKQIHERMDREMGMIHSRLDETNRILIQIAQNTRPPE